jgi:tyrosinase
MASTAVVSRENIESWAPDSPKLLLFRKGIEGMQAISEQSLMDERGYQYMAGVHGGFGGQPFCAHGNLNFLTWHRPYLLDFELKLRAQIAKATSKAQADEWRLPYWQWDAAGVTGLPEAFTDPTYVDDAGVEQPNPLFSQPYQLPYPVDGLDPADRTYRDPGSIPQLQSFKELVDEAATLQDYRDFCTAIENPHNQIHGWVGGFMGDYRSAFDPIFWSHHANIDRQFWVWQQTDGHMASIPAAVRAYECQPFRFRNLRAEAFFDTRALGYTYNADRRLVETGDAVVRGGAGAPIPPRVFAFGDVHPGFTRARLNVHNVRHPEKNCKLVFFANREEPATAATPHTEAEGYLGAYMVLGHGPCPGAPGHCDPDAQTGGDLRGPHHLAPFDLFVTITRPLQRLLDAGEAPVAGELIVVDNKGEALPTDALRFDNVTLTLA